MFNNLLIYASPPTADAKKYRIHRTIHLALCRLQDLKDRPNNPDLPIKNAFIIVNPQKELTVMCDDPMIKQAWLMDVKKSIESTLIRHKKWIEKEEAKFFEPSASKTRVNSVVNGTREDSAAESKRQADQFLAQSVVGSSTQDNSRCRLCIQPFGTFSRRKFNCPYCKQIVCSDCSTKLADIPGEGGKFGNRPQRVCDACDGIISGIVRLDQPILERET